MATENPGKTAGETQPDALKAGETQPVGGERKTTDEEAKLLKENMALKAALKKKEAADAAAEEKRLKDQGEFKTLAEKADARAKAATAKLTLKAVEVMAIQAGIIDTDAVRLADLSSVTADDDGNVTGAAEAIEALKASKPYLFGSTTTTPGAKPTTTPKPSGSTTGSGGPSTFDEWMKMPTVDRYAWAEKNSAAYHALCDAAKAQKRTF